MLQGKPCGSTTRSRDRWTRAHLVAVAKQHNISTSGKNMTAICLELQGVLTKRSAAKLPSPTRPGSRPKPGTPSKTLRDLSYNEIRRECTRLRSLGAISKDKKCRKKRAILEGYIRQANLRATTKPKALKRVARKHKTSPIDSRLQPLPYNELRRECVRLRSLGAIPADKNCGKKRSILEGYIRRVPPISTPVRQQKKDREPAKLPSTPVPRQTKDRKPPKLPSTPVRQQKKVRKPAKVHVSKRPSVDLPTSLSPSLSFLDRFYLIIFDFDCTISQKHTCGNPRLRKEDVSANLDLYVSASNAKIFIGLVTSLLASGRKVAIASFGTQDVIIALLQQLWHKYARGTASPFTRENVITPRVVGWSDCHEPAQVGQSKLNMLTLLAQRYAVSDPSHILLVDDTAKNVSGAKAAGFDAVKVSRCKGFAVTEKEMEKIKVPDFGRIALVVLDFDCTITAKHTCKPPITQAYAIKNMRRFISVRDGKRFIKFIQELEKLGVRIAIATFGEKRIVLTLLKTLWQSENVAGAFPFDAKNIITPVDVGWRECHLPPSGLSKDAMLDALSSRTGIPFSEILLIDDKLNYVKEANAAGYSALQVPACQGFAKVLDNLKFMGVPGT